MLFQKAFEFPLVNMCHWLRPLPVPVVVVVVSVIASAVALAFPCSACLRVCDLCRLGAHGCLLFDLWLAFELIISDKVSQARPPPHLSHCDLSSAAPRPSPCRRARSSLSVGYRAALRPFLTRREHDLYLPSQPPPPSESTSRVYQPVQGGVCRREIQEQIDGGRINKALAVTNKESGEGWRWHVYLPS